MAVAVTSQGAYKMLATRGTSFRAIDASPLFFAKRARILAATFTDRQAAALCASCGPRAPG